MDVVDDVVYVLHGVLLVGGVSVSGGSEASSEVRITAKIRIPITMTAAAPAAKIVPGRFNQ